MYSPMLLSPAVTGLMAIRSALQIWHRISRLDSLLSSSIIPGMFLLRNKLLDRHRPGLFEVFLYEIEDLGKSFVMDPSHHLDVLPETITSTEQVSQHDDVFVYIPLMISLHFDIPLL